MTVRGVPAPHSYQPDLYWEDRARRFAMEPDGLAAICSYGMPGFYNRAIDWEQRRALAPWLNPRPGTRVLDVGCGIGRWSHLLAQRGALVLGVDLSPTMIGEARRRAAQAGLEPSCHFAVADVSRLALGERFDLVLAVTVLQHVVERTALRAALRAMATHLELTGRLVLLEAAPLHAVPHFDSTVFTARRRQDYIDIAAECGLTLDHLRSVDPAPFRRRLLPHLRKLPGSLRMPLTALATALSLPLNLVGGARSLARSWHVVFVLKHEGAD